MWAPRGGAGAEIWWPDAPSADPWHLGPNCDLALFGTGADVTPRAGAVEASWRSGHWQPDLAQARLAIGITPCELRIDVPAVWRAHCYLGWRGNCLLVASDLRTLVAAMPSATPSAEGIACFLAGSRALAGLVPSLYRDIWEIQPGHAVIVTADARMRCIRTWTPEREQSFAAQPLGPVTGRVRAHLGELSGQILASYDRVACLFSGGLDSTLVAATFRQAANRVTLFNVGSGLGTATEATLRSRFLRDADMVSHAVDLPPEASLLRSLRATNTVAPLPVGSLFAHVFEEIIAVAQARGCRAIVTGDGGDEVFTEREDILVDLVANRSRTSAALGYFALLNGERGTRALSRARHRLRALNACAAPPGDRCDPNDALLADGLAELVRACRTEAAVREAELWQAGWTCSGIGRYRRAACVPEWEPVSADSPGFPVISPLVDAALVTDALSLRPDAAIVQTGRSQPKWLLRQAALTWLTPDVALHPKIGSADTQILERLRAAELPGLLDLLSSGTARSLGLTVPGAAEQASSRLWHGDGWLRGAALVAWFDQAAFPSHSGPPRTIVTARSRRDPAWTPPASPAEDAGRGTANKAVPGRLQVCALAVLNLAAQVAAAVRIRPGQPASVRVSLSPSDNSLAWTLTALARRACALPFVTGSAPVMTRALAWYLRLGGERPVVVRGYARGDPASRYWIELGGSIIDVSGSEAPLTAGQPEPAWTTGQPISVRQADSSGIPRRPDR